MLFDDVPVDVRQTKVSSWVLLRELLVIHPEEMEDRRVKILDVNSVRRVESEFVDYEVRQLVVGSHLLLSTIDEERRTVWIVGLRHGQRLPRPRELPSDPEENDEPNGGV